MKTIDEFIQEISASEALQNELSAIIDKEAFENFLKEHGCEASVKEFVERIKAQDGAELDDEALCAVTGGSPLSAMVKLMPKAMAIIQKFAK